MLGKSAVAQSRPSFVWLGLSCFAAIVGFSAGHWATAREPAARLTTLLSSGQTVTGEAIAYPSGAPAKITAVVLTLQPGEQTGLHTHGVPAFGYVLEGELTVDYVGQTPRVYKTGDAVLEAMSVAHNGRNTGAVPMRILAVFMGAEGVPVSAAAGAQ